MRRGQRDSMTIFEWCVYGLGVTVLALVLVSFAADALDKEADMTEAKVAAHVGRMNK